MLEELTVPVKIKKATIEKMTVNMELEISGSEGTVQPQVIQKSFEVDVNTPISLI